MSEAGMLYRLKEQSPNKFTISTRAEVFSDGGHKLASLAFDSYKRHFYTAEKEGEKTIYQLDEQGSLLGQFELTLSPGLSQAQSNAYSLADDYTIAGMHYRAGSLYLFSEAYSTVFVLDLERREVVEIIGVPGLPESAGLTTRDGRFYFIGDFEDSLPAPRVHVARVN